MRELRYTSTSSQRWSLWRGKILPFLSRVTEDEQVLWFMTDLFVRRPVKIRRRLTLVAWSRRWPAAGPGRSSATRAPARTGRRTGGGRRTPRPRPGSSWGRTPRSASGSTPTSARPCPATTRTTAKIYKNEFIADAPAENVRKGNFDSSCSN